MKKLDPKDNTRFSLWLHKTTGDQYDTTTVHLWANTETKRFIFVKLLFHVGSHNIIEQEWSNEFVLAIDQGLRKVGLPGYGGTWHIQFEKLSPMDGKIYLSRLHHSHYDTGLPVVGEQMFSDISSEKLLEFLTLDWIK